MSNVIDLNIAEIDSIVGGTRVNTAMQLNVPNKTAMAVPNVSAYSASLTASRPVRRTTPPTFRRASTRSADCHPALSVSLEGPAGNVPAPGFSFPRESTVFAATPTFAPVRPRTHS